MEAERDNKRQKLAVTFKEPPVDALGEAAPLPPSALAQDVIKLRFVDHEADLAAPAAAVRVEFAHQLFDGERVTGCTAQELSVQVTFSSAALDCWVDVAVTSDGGLHGADAEAVRTDVLQRLAPALPCGHTCDRARFATELLPRNATFKIPGTPVHRYARAGSRAFSILRATGADPGALAYHDSAQRLALWYIETADGVDISDDRWEVYYIVRQPGLRGSGGCGGSGGGGGGDGGSGGGGGGGGSSGDGGGGDGGSGNCGNGSAGRFGASIGSHSATVSSANNGGGGGPERDAGADGAAVGTGGACDPGSSGNGHQAGAHAESAAACSGDGGGGADGYGSSNGDGGRDDSAGEGHSGIAEHCNGGGEAESAASRLHGAENSTGDAHIGGGANGDGANGCGGDGSCDGSGGGGNSGSGGSAAALVGYFTVFSFRNPVKGISMRVCQALVLPMYQRQGHGREVMEYLYRVARERPACYEVTVEDPAPSFVHLRDAIDAEHCRREGVLDEVLAVSPPRPLRIAEADATARRLKITSAQAEAAYELLRMAALVEGDEETERLFRLMVKRRLYQRLGAALSADPAVRKAQLEELYQDVVDERYRPLLPRLRAARA